MAKLEINGRIVEVDDSFRTMSPEQQQSVVRQIASSLSGSAPSAGGPGSADYAGHLAGVGARAGAQGVVGGVLGLPAMVADSAMGVTRDIRAGARYLGAQAGIGEYDPRDYYPEGGSPSELGIAGAIGLKEDAPTSMPLTQEAARVARVLPDAIGLPQPQTRAERVASAGLEGLAAAGTGIGMGTLLMRLPGSVAKAAGATLATAPRGQLVGGSAAGAGSQSVLEAGGDPRAAMLTGGILGLTTGAAADSLFRPSAAIDAGTSAGRQIVAGRVMRGLADDPDAAIANLGRAGDTALPGWRHVTSNAARDLGIAAVAPKLRSYANIHDSGAIAGIERNNASILSRELDALGGAPGMAEGARRAASDNARQALYGIDLKGRPPVDVTDLLNELDSLKELRGSGNRSSVSDAAQFMSDQIRTRAVPKLDVSGNPVGFSIAPNDLAAIRADLSEARNQTFAGGPTQLAASLKTAQEQTRPAFQRIDTLLDDATDGQWSDLYLRPFRDARSDADAMSFMEGLGNATNRNGVRYDTGERQISPGAFLTETAPGRFDRKVGGRISRRRLEQTHPLHADFIDRARTDLQASNFDQSPGLATRGSNTDQNREIGRLVESEVRAARSTPQKLADAALDAADAGAEVISRLGGPFGSLGARTALGMVKGFSERRALTQQQAVEATLGQMQVDPAYAARVMRETGKLPDPFTPSAAMLRLMLKGGILSSAGAFQGRRAGDTR
ncbi:hypothetical protein [Aureimonas altamirensis]|uniref:hypothetical protein n=1 Tax=Aureimonas altamirensis TaxID=370622 RepID=UPI003016E628